MADDTLVWTTTADVRDRWIGDEPLKATDPQIKTLLEDAEDTVLREFPDMVSRVARAAGLDTTDGPMTPLRRVKKVIARMVIRHLRNPKGIRQTQEGAGPFQRSMTMGGEEPGAIYLTDEDRAELGGHRSGGAFTIDTLPSVAPPDSPNSWLTLGRTWH